MKVLFDANTILNGIFLPHSQSRKVLEKLSSGHFIGAVCQDTLVEAQGAVERAYRNTGIDLSRAFESATMRLPLIKLPPVANAERCLYGRIKGSGDRAIVATAKTYGLTICTNDIKDFRYASHYGVAVSTPEQLTAEGGPSLAKIALGNLASKEQGTIYMVVSPSWVGVDIDKRLDKRFYFFDTPTVGGLWYDNAHRSLIYESDLGPRVELNIAKIGKDSLPFRVTVTYHFEKGVSLYFGYQGKKTSLEAKWVPKPMSPSTRTYIGSDRTATNQINGLVSLFTSLPTVLSETGVNNLMKGHSSAHPWERLSLEQVISYLFG